MITELEFNIICNVKCENVYYDEHGVIRTYGEFPLPAAAPLHINGLIEPGLPDAHGRRYAMMTPAGLRAEQEYIDAMEHHEPSAWEQFQQQQRDVFGF